MMDIRRLTVTFLTAGVSVVGAVAFWRLRIHLNGLEQLVYCLWILASWSPTIAMWKAPLHGNERDWPHYQALMADVLVLVAFSFFWVLNKAIK